MKSWARRDLTICDIGDKSIIIACDSCGGIGMKEGDCLNISTYDVAKLTVRVGLTEVMCSGAIPIVITNNVACEMNPTGKECIRGIKAELINAGLENISITGSTEENFKTVMTAMGISVIGIAEKNTLKFNKAFHKDKVVLIGTPQIGNEVSLESKGFYKSINYLLSLPNVREIVPVGSKGIKYEAKTLAQLNGMVFKAYDTDVDIYKSAGPSTCIIVLCSDETAKLISGSILNTVVVGELK